jgi:hypothetical protein
MHRTASLIFVVFVVTVVLAPGVAIAQVQPGSIGGTLGKQVLEQSRLETKLPFQHRFRQQPEVPPAAVSSERGNGISAFLKRSSTRTGLRGLVLELPALGYVLVQPSVPSIPTESKSDTRSLTTVTFSLSLAPGAEALRLPQRGSES